MKTRALTPSIRQSSSRVTTTLYHCHSGPFPGLPPLLTLASSPVLPFYCLHALANSPTMFLYILRMSESIL